jgi:hypothetical protein
MAYIGIYIWPVKGWVGAKVYLGRVKDMVRDRVRVRGLGLTPSPNPNFNPDL